jgi:predicted methyltransferase
LLAGCATAQAPGLSPERAAAIVASPDRSAADRTNDVRRKPAEMLAFIGVREGMVALDISAAGGYTTELIARAVGPGRVYGQTRAPDPRQRLAERAKNPAAGNIIPVVRPFDDPVPPELAANALDLVTLMFNYHDFANIDRAQMNRYVFAALKPGGLYVVADHSGRPGTGISESNTLHRIEEAFLRKEVEAAGFQLVAEGGFLRNPNDPRDRETPEPAQPKDEFILKFRKP